MIYQLQSQIVKVLPLTRPLFTYVKEILRKCYFTVWKTSVRNIFNHLLVLDASRLRSGTPSRRGSNRPRSVSSFLHSVNTAPPESYPLTDALKRVIFQRPTLGKRSPLYVSRVACAQG